MNYDAKRLRLEQERKEENHNAVTMYNLAIHQYLAEQEDTIIERYNHTLCEIADMSVYETTDFILLKNCVSNELLGVIYKRYNYACDCSQYHDEFIPFNALMVGYFIATYAPEIEAIFQYRK